MERVVADLANIFIGKNETCLHISVGKPIFFGEENPTIVYSDPPNGFEMKQYLATCVILIINALNSDEAVSPTSNELISYVKPDFPIFNDLLCSPNEVYPTPAIESKLYNDSDTYNDVFQFMLDYDYSLVIQVGGNPYLASAKPYIYIPNQNLENTIKMYTFCPNATLRPWKILNLYSVKNETYLLPMPERLCDHPLRNQYMIAAYWSGGGVQRIIEIENSVLEFIASYYRAKKIINYCIPIFSFNLRKPGGVTSEGMVYNGLAHFAGSYQAMEPGIPFDFLYPFKNIDFSIYSRHLKLLPPWTNMTNVFDKVVWFFIIGVIIVIPAVVYFMSRIYSNYIYGSDVVSESYASMSAIMITTVAIAVEPRESWFKSKAIGGRQLFLTWAVMAFFLNMAFNSNLRAVLLSPQTEKPVESFNDAVLRGQHIWVGHFVYNPDKPEQVDQYFLDKRLKPCIGEFIREKEMETYTYVTIQHMPWKVWEDIRDNGASVMLPEFHSKVYPVLFNRDIMLRKGKESVLKSLMHRTMLMNTKTTWKTDADYLVMLLRQTGLLEKLERNFIGHLANIYYDVKQTSHSGIKIGVDHFFIPNLFLLAGYCYALLTFLFEVCQERATSNKMHRAWS